MTYDTDTIKVTQGQRDLAAYIKRETGKAIKAESIALVDALRVAYRNDPQRIADREAQRNAAKAKKQERLQATLAKARKLAESLGLDPDALSAGFQDNPEFEESEPETAEEAAEVFEEDEDDVEEEPEPEPEPEPAPKAKRKPAARKTSSGKTVQAVPEPADPTPADEEALSPDIDVMEEEDGWAEVKSSDDEDDFEDFDDDDDDAEDF